MLRCPEGKTTRQACGFCGGLILLCLRGREGAEGWGLDQGPRGCVCKGGCLWGRHC